MSSIWRPSGPVTNYRGAAALYRVRRRAGRHAQPDCGARRAGHHPDQRRRQRRRTHRCERRRAYRDHGTPRPRQPLAGPAFKTPNPSLSALMESSPRWTRPGHTTFPAPRSSPIYEPLLAPKREKTSEFVGVLATRWTLSADGKTYTFTIRKGVKFHNGEDLTPEDVAYSFQRGMMQDRAGGPQWILLQPFFGLDVQSFKGDVVEKQNNKDWSKACAAVKDAVGFDNAAGTVTMHLKQPYGPMLQIFVGGWGSVLSKPWVFKQGGWTGDCATAESTTTPNRRRASCLRWPTAPAPSSSSAGLPVSRSR